MQLGWGHPQGCGCGLNNLGNSCYLNSVLQALAYLPPVGQRALSRQHGRACPRAAAGHADCAACLVEARLGRCLRGDPAQPESPMQLLNNLGLLSSGLRRYQQEDAHEALRLVVDAMHRDCLRATFGWGYKPPPGQKVTPTLLPPVPLPPYSSHCVCHRHSSHCICFRVPLASPPTTTTATRLPAAA